jgi:PAS domain S-box-containing protein
MHRNSDKQKRMLRHAVAVAACLVIVLGTTTTGAWFISRDALPGALASTLFDMKFNTALAFIISGIGLVSALRELRRSTLAAGSAVCFIAGVTLLEYLTNTDLGFDQIFVKGIYHAASLYPDRMAPGSALAFVCAGLHLVLQSRSSEGSVRISVAEALGFMVFALGAESLIGRLQGIELAYSWGSHRAMSVQSAAGLMVLGGGLLALVWHGQKAGIARVPLWVPGLLCFAVLLFDLNTPRGVVAGIAYIPLVFCSLWFSRPQTVFVFAAIATILTVAVFFFLAPNGIAIWMEVLNRALTIGALWFMATVLYSRRASEQAFRQSEVRLNAVVDYALDGMISINERGTIEHFNHACVRIFGYTAAEVIGQNIKILMPEPYHGEHDGYLSRYHAGGEAHIIGTAGREVLAKRKDGSIFPMDLSISAYELENGRHYSGIVRDITQRKQVEEKAAMLSTIVESSDDAIISKGLDGTILSWNAGAERLFGYTDVEIVGRNISLLVPDHLLDEEKNIIAQLQQGKTVIHYETEHLHKSGKILAISTTISAIRDLAGKLVGASKIAHDFSVRKEAEKVKRHFNEILELRVAERTSQLKAANDELEEFAYIASHDLKAPLRVIDNASKWLEEDLQEHLTPETRESMTLLRGRVGRMEKLLDDLLEYSRIGRVADDRRVEIVTGGVLMDNILMLLSPPAGFVVTASPAFAGLSVRRMPLQQILMNLIGNAIKHHHKTEGCIEVTVEDDGAFYAFSVKDDGPGIPAQFQDQVFRMFQTLKPRDQVEGSGMGLAMVRKNIEVAGGTLVLESTEGEGSDFRFTLPKQQQAMRQSA